MSEKFRKIPDFDFCGIKWATVNGTAIAILADGHMNVSKARHLRDWLTSALPCEHKGPRRGTLTWGEPLKVTCDACGEEVPSTWVMGLV